MGIHADTDGSTEVQPGREVPVRERGNIEEVERKRIIAVAVGRAISIGLAMPTSEITVTPEHYYDDNHQSTVNRIVSALNEMYVLDVGLVIDTARMYFTFRYRMIYDPNMFAEFLDRCMLWSDDILPARVKELAQCAMSRPDFNK